MSLPDPCPKTNRRVVTVAEWHNRPDKLIDEYAYWYNSEAAELGLDPWRLIEAVDPRISKNRYDVDYVGGGYKTISGEQEIYVRPDHFALLNLDRP